MRTTIIASLVLGLAACTSASQDASLSHSATSFVSVSAADLAALDEDETLAIDLTLTDVVYELDGDTAPLDLDRLTVVTPAFESIPMRDFLDLRALGVDENDFFLRLSGNNALLFEEPSLGSTSQALKGRVGGGGGGGLGFVCIPGWCTCSGYDDCIDMFDGNACGPLGGCDDTNGTNCWCLPPLRAGTKTPGTAVSGPGSGLVLARP